MPVISYAKGSDTADGLDVTSTSSYVLVTSTGALFGGQSVDGNGVYHYYDGLNGSGVDFNLDNAGQIYGANYGIYADKGAIITNEKSGSISNEIFMTGYGYINNYGYISAVATGYNAIYASSGAHVTNNGTINGTVDLYNTGGYTNTFDGFGGTVNGSIEGGIGRDTFDLSHQTVTGGIYGEGGEDKVSFDSASGGMIVDLATGYATGAGEQFTLNGISDVLGSHYADTITGDGNANMIAAGIGNDVVSGGDGNDTIDGGAGNDVLDGGAGTGDTVSYTGAAGGVTVNLLLQGHAQNTGGAGTDTLTGFENINGSEYADVLTGDGGNNTIYGYGGADVIDGGAGNDILYGFFSGSTVSYASATAGVTVNLASTVAQNTVGDGIDTLSGFYNLTGSAFGDKLFGSQYNNVINGAAGNDIITGGAGQDVLTGGAGGDRFVFNASTDSPTATPDLISDFLSGTDKIDLTGLHLIANSEITISSSGGYTYVAVDSDNSGTADMLIKVIGTNAVKTTDLLTGLTSAAATHAIASDTDTAAHHDLVDTLHAVAVDHGLYG